VVINTTIPNPPLDDYQRINDEAIFSSLLSTPRKLSQSYHTPKFPNSESPQVFSNMSNQAFQFSQGRFESQKKIDEESKAKQEFFTGFMTETKKERYPLSSLTAWKQNKRAPTPMDTAMEIENDIQQLYKAKRVLVNK